MDFWHGSPTLLHVGDFLIPGAKIGVDRYDMGRNRAVFLSSDRNTAIWYGNTESTVRIPGERIIYYAPYLYRVHPIYLYSDCGKVGPHQTKVPGEHQCRKAEVLERWKCENPHGKQIICYDKDGKIASADWSTDREHAIYNPMDNDD